MNTTNTKLVRKHVYNRGGLVWCIVDKNGVVIKDTGHAASGREMFKKKEMIHYLKMNPVVSK